MQSKCSSTLKALGAGEAKNIVNLRFTHKESPVTLLERVALKEPQKILEGIQSLDFVQECVILQTCNRAEIYAAISDPDFKNGGSEIAEYWRQRTGIDKEEFYQSLKEAFNAQALIHLLRVSSGLESMIVGEDQILGQVQEAVDEAKQCGTVGPILETSFERAIKTGRKVRVRTKIDKGAVSIGSAAVDLLEEAVGDLKDKRIIVIGAGETGGLVGKALASREYAVIYVANRTYERGVRLARMLGGQAVRFNKVKDFLACVDAAIVATAAPHYVLTKKLVQEALDKRKSGTLLIMDLSQPRNVEESVADLPNIELHNIDDLRGIAEVNRKMRRREIKKVERIVENELKRLELTLKRKRVDPLISALCNKAEEIRRKELEKALKMLGKLDDDQRKVVDDLTMVLVKRILHHPLMNLRKAAVSGNINTISAARELFNISPFKERERSDVS